MADIFHLNDFSKPIYLHHSMQKFWEIKLDQMTYKATVRCGKLFENGSEDALSIQKVEKENKSWGDAVTYAEKHIKMKLDKGYSYLDKNSNESSSIKFSLSPPKHDFLTSSPPPETNGNGNHLKRRGDDAILQRDDLKQPKKMDRQQSFDYEAFQKTLEAQEAFEAKQKELGEFTQKAYRIENLKDSEKPRIENKAAELELICDFMGTKISVSGYEKRIDQFVVFLKQFIQERKKAEATENSTKEIPISSNAVKFASEIEEKGLSLGLICEVHEKSVLAQGSTSKIAEFEKFLKEKEIESMTGPSPAKSMEDTTTKREVKLTSAMKKAQGEIEKKGDQLGIFSEFTPDKLIMLGTSEAISELLTYMFEMNETQEQTNKEDPGEYTQKEVKVTKSINELMSDIKKKAETLDIILDFADDKLLIAGYEKKITEIMKFIEEKEKEIEKEKTTSNSSNTNISITIPKSGEKGDYVQKEISISTFHRVCQEEIEAKAKELDLICDFGYDVILLTGFTGNIGMFIAYLYEVESQSKKSLYPKYWDFHEVNPFSMAAIQEDTQEFKDVEKLFFQTMRGQTIIKLQRIQNKYLMDHYVTNIQKRRELRPNEPINRMLLFHGTRNTKPEIIYKNFDVGFDLQYAAQGMYGKGLYFAVGAQYSHSGFVHRNSKGNCELIIADVFVGKSKNSSGGNFIKAPEGYDSISANGGFYIIYNNFHSYPLYLLEYR